MNKIITLRTASFGKDAMRTTPDVQGVSTSGVYVLFTSLDATLAASRAARDLAAAMGVPLTVVHFRPVPYALPLSDRPRMPDAEADSLADRLKAEGIDASVRVYLCRSAREAAALTLAPHSLIVVGDARPWWPFTRAAARRRALERAGHTVVSVCAAQYRLAREPAAERPRRTSAPARPAAGVATFSRGLAGHSLKERARA
jgi:hypothetical protein